MDTYDEASNEFTVLWQDNFDSVDETKWTRTDGYTWDGTRTIYFANQIVADDSGKLVITMDHDIAATEEILQ